jgi:hypothetical protein
MSRPCFVCKKPIELERLDAIPETRLCTDHGHAIQKYGGEFFLSAAQERTSKKSSMKVNYGGISTYSTRNHDALERLKEDFYISQMEN